MCYKLLKSIFFFVCFIPCEKLVWKCWVYVWVQLSTAENDFPVWFLQVTSQCGWTSREKYSVTLCAPLVHIACSDRCTTLRGSSTKIFLNILSHQCSCWFEERSQKMLSNAVMQHVAKWFRDCKSCSWMFSLYTGMCVYIYKKIENILKEIWKYLEKNWKISWLCPKCPYSLIHYFLYNIHWIEPQHCTVILTFIKFNALHCGIVGRKLCTCHWPYFCVPVWECILYTVVHTFHTFIHILTLNKMVGGKHSAQYIWFIDTAFVLR